MVRDDKGTANNVCVQDVHSANKKKIDSSFNMFTNKNKKKSKRKKYDWQKDVSQTENRSYTIAIQKHPTRLWLLPLTLMFFFFIAFRFCCVLNSVCLAYVSMRINESEYAKRKPVNKKHFDFSLLSTTKFAKLSAIRKSIFHQMWFMPIFFLKWFNFASKSSSQPANRSSHILNWKGVTNKRIVIEIQKLQAYTH